MITSLNIPEQWARVRELLGQIPAAREAMRRGPTQALRDEGTRRYVKLVDAVVELTIELDRARVLDEFDELIAVHYGGGRP